MNGLDHLGDIHLAIFKDGSILIHAESTIRIHHRFAEDKVSEAIRLCHYIQKPFLHSTLGNWHSETYPKTPAILGMFGFMTVHDFPSLQPVNCHSLLWQMDVIYKGFSKKKSHGDFQ